MAAKRGFRKYFKAYQMSDMLAMVRNNKAEPLKCSSDFTGRLVVITGATSGIGRETAREYARHGASLV